MGRHRDPDKRRWTSAKFGGYVLDFHGMAHSVYERQRVSTGLKWHPDNKAKAIEFHEKRAEAMWREKHGLAPVERPTVKLYAAVEQFLTARAQDLTPGVARWFAESFRGYFTADMPLDYDSITGHLITRYSELSDQYAQATRRKHLQHLKRFFRFTVDRGWLDRNPVDVMAIPKEPRKLENRVYTPAEIDAIIEMNLRRKETALHGHLVRFLYLTAMRVSEALALRWSDIRADGIRIVGKGMALRYIPLATPPAGADPAAPVWQWQQEIRATLETVRTMREDPVYLHMFGTARAAYVFPWHATNTVLHQLRVVKGQLGMGNPIELPPPKKSGGKRELFPTADGDDGRTVHTIRASALWYWRVVLRFPVDLSCDLAGHSIAVHTRDYRRNPTADELTGALHGLPTAGIRTAVLPAAGPSIAGILAGEHSNGKA